MEQHGCQSWPKAKPRWLTEIEEFMVRLRSPNGDRLDSPVSHFRVRWRTLLLRALAESGGDRVVELECDYEGDAPAGVDDAQRRAEGVKALADYDAAFDGFGDFTGHVILQDA